MPINTERIEAILRRYQALVQRQERINSVIQVFLQNTVWRTPGGDLAIELTAEDKQRIKAWLVEYLDESQAIIDSIRAELA